MANGAVAVAGAALSDEGLLLIPRSRPAQAEYIERICALRLPGTSEVAVMAPALIIGLRGRPVCGSRLIELNASPVGSTPMC